MTGIALVPRYGSNAGIGFVVKSVTQGTDGYWEAQNFDGSYVSVDGSGGVRASSSVGPWEKAGGEDNKPAPDGTELPSVLTYHIGGGAPVFTFAVNAVVPNVSL